MHTDFRHWKIWTGFCCACMGQRDKSSSDPRPSVRIRVPLFSLCSLRLCGLLLFGCGHGAALGCLLQTLLDAVEHLSCLGDEQYSLRLAIPPLTHINTIRIHVSKV